MQLMGKMITSLFYGTSATSGVWWVLQLLDRVSLAQWAALEVLASIFFGLLTLLLNFYYRAKADRRKTTRGKHD